VVLREVAAAARKVLRDVDILARYGGEELVALLPETSPEEALRAAERVRMGIESMQLSTEVDGVLQAVKVTASIGVSTFPSEGVSSMTALVQIADECLYTAKANGRNQVRQA
jgi:diguanylate cyclase (GGDEF)-like protein